MVKQTVVKNLNNENMHRMYFAFKVIIITIDNLNMSMFVTYKYIYIYNLSRGWYSFVLQINEIKWTQNCPNCQNVNIKRRTQNGPNCQNVNIKRREFKRFYCV